MCVSKLPNQIKRLRMTGEPDGKNAHDDSLSFVLSNCRMRSNTGVVRAAKTEGSKKGVTHLLASDKTHFMHVYIQRSYHTMDVFFILLQNLKIISAAISSKKAITGSSQNHMQRSWPHWLQGAPIAWATPDLVKSVATWLALTFFWILLLHLTASTYGLLFSTPHRNWHKIIG